MKPERSNLQITSNVYPVNVTENYINMKANSLFVSRITDRDALRRLVDIIHPGLNYNDQRNYAQTIPGISDWQAKRIKIPDECALSPTGERPWGFSIINGELNYVCKCNIRSCGHFDKCRPEEVTNVPED